MGPALLFMTVVLHIHVWFISQRWDCVWHQLRGTQDGGGYRCLGDARAGPACPAAPQALPQPALCGGEIATPPSVITEAIVLLMCKETNCWS